MGEKGRADTEGLLYNKIKHGRTMEDNENNRLLNQQMSEENEMKKRNGGQPPDEPQGNENEVLSTEQTQKVLYGVEDVPSAPLCFLFGLQQAIMCVGGTIAIPYILSNLICAKDKPDVTSTLLSITMFMCGIATIIQSLFGIRLGIIQGGSHAFVAPIVALMSIEKVELSCSGFSTIESDIAPETEILPVTKAKGIYGEAQYEAIAALSVLQIYSGSKMLHLQGNLILASLTQIILGCTGLMGFLTRFIGPLTIAPTISLIGLSLASVAARFSKVHWGISCLTTALILLFSLYLRKIKVPIPAWTRRNGCHLIKYPIFQLFPVILSICCSWLFCYVLTVTDVFPNNPKHPDYMTRTDARVEVVNLAPWFYWPYPFQFGFPTVSVGGYIGFLAATLSSIIESIGDYYAAANLSGSPPPPAHAVNRGIAVEGISSIVAGMVGFGHGTTSYSGNIGAIGITKVASRRVFVTAGVILMVFGIIGKIGAVFSMIPEPIIGGTVTVLFGMVAAVGISTLKFIDLDSIRNLTILGVSLLLGLVVPQYVHGATNIKTGNEELDQVIKVLLGTAMFVGGLTGFILDNTVPGTEEERGITAWRRRITTGTTSDENTKLYEFPYVTKYFRKANCCSYVPVSPTFNKELKEVCCCNRKNGTTESKNIFDNPVIVNEEHL